MARVPAYYHNPPTNGEDYTRCDHLRNFRINRSSHLLTFQIWNVLQGEVNSVQSRHTRTTGSTSYSSCSSNGMAVFVPGITVRMEHICNGSAIKAQAITPELIERLQCLHEVLYNPSYLWFIRESRPCE